MGNGKQFQEMMKNMTKNMGNLGAMANMASAGKGAKFDMGAMQRMSAQYSQKERMRAKLDEKKKAKDVVLEKKGENAYSFKIDGEEMQEKSSRPDMRIPNIPMPVPAPASVINDDWLDEPEKTPNTNSVSKKKSKSKGKGKGKK
jgi:sortase (surface protein transpeptidase)